MKKYRLCKKPSEETGFSYLYKSNKKWTKTKVWDKIGNKLFTKDELVECLLNYFKINNSDFPSDWIVEEYKVETYMTKTENPTDFMVKTAKKPLIKL
jgi:hypothetical protein